MDAEINKQLEDKLDEQRRMFEEKLKEQEEKLKKEQEQKKKIIEDQAEMKKQMELFMRAVNSSKKKPNLTSHPAYGGRSHCEN